MMRNVLDSLNRYLTLIIFGTVFSLFCLNGLAQTTQTFTSSGTFNVPAGVTSIKVEAWGGGGAGGRAVRKNSAGGGGAGGSYAASVLSGLATSYPFIVGAAKTSAANNTASNNNGNPSYFGSSLVYAIGGPGGAGAASNTNALPGTGTITNCIGNVRYSGGNGSTGNLTAGIPGGAGGGGAGSTGAGGSANAGTGGSGTSLGGGNGANGVANNTNGATGFVYGGGGSGGKAGNQNKNGGSGAAGLIKVTYLQSITGTITVCAGSTTALSNLATGGTWSSGTTSVATVNSSTGVVTGVAAGTSVITYSVPSGIGNLTVTTTVTVLARPAAPTIGTITQLTCFSAIGSIALNGLPSSGWTVTKYPGGATTSGSETSTTISGLTAGTYSFTVTNASGCTSFLSANAVINTQPETPTEPVIGTITQPTCSNATGSVVLSGLPSTGTWVLEILLPPESAPVLPFQV
jgi:hypothetical protein